MAWRIWMYKEKSDRVYFEYLEYKDGFDIAYEWALKQGYVIKDYYGWKNIRDWGSSGIHWLWKWGQSHEYC